MAEMIGSTRGGDIRGLETAKAMPARTRLQERIDSEIAMHLEAASERRAKGSPEDMPEIDRELAMATGALEGLYQRVGALAAVLAPVMFGSTLHELVTGPSRVDSGPETETEVGQRIRSITRAISEVEDALGTLVTSVRL